MISKKQKIKLFNKGYITGLGCEFEFAKALIEIMTEIAEVEPESKWPYVLQGFENGLCKQLELSRKEELKSVKKQKRNRSNSKGKSR